MLRLIFQFRSLTKKKKLEEHKKRIAETESMIATKSDLLKEVESLLSSLGSDGPPKALDLPDMTGDNLVGFLSALFRNREKYNKLICCVPMVSDVYAKNSVDQNHNTPRGASLIRVCTVCHSICMFWRHSALVVSICLNCLVITITLEQKGKLKYIHVTSTNHAICCEFYKCKIYCFQ